MQHQTPEGVTMESEDIVIANDIYERLELGGSVYDDIYQYLVEGDLDALEDYFGDLDPTEYL